MSQTITYTCDKCGTLISGPMTALNIRGGFGHYPTRHLCAGCNDALRLALGLPAYRHVASVDVFILEAPGPDAE